MLERRWAPWLLAGLLAIWLPCAAMFHDIDYDEGQYVAAVALMRSGLPFRDFLYLQTPLHPLLLSPLAWLAQDHLFVALRLANAAMVGATMLLIYRAILAQGGKRSMAWLAVALMALCEPIIFIAGVARNDATPMLLEALGLALLLKNWRTPGAAWSFFFAGLFMGAAISTKLHFALVAGAAGGVMLLDWRRIGLPAISLYAIGGIFGCLPVALFWLLAPGAFLFGVFDYPLNAPWQWYELGNRVELFTAPVVALRLFRFTAVGPTLVALIVILLGRLRMKRQSEVALLLDILIIAGLIAAIMPQPIFRQYLAPLYPPLFIRFGLVQAWWPRRAVWKMAILISTFAALVETAHVEGGNILSNAARASSPPYEAVRDAHWLGRMAPAGTRVAGLAPERFVDSGLVVDPRFATGPFLFRTVGLVSPAQAHAWRVVPAAQMDALFALDPPDIIVAGGHRTADVAAPRGLDEGMERWARRHGWSARLSPSGALTIYSRPEAR